MNRRKAASRREMAMTNFEEKNFEKFQKKMAMPPTILESPRIYICVVSNQTVGQLRDVMEIQPLNYRASD